MQTLDFGIKVFHFVRKKKLFLNISQVMIEIGHHNVTGKTVYYLIKVIARRQGWFKLIRGSEQRCSFLKVWMTFDLLYLFVRMCEKRLTTGYLRQ